MGVAARRGRGQPDHVEKPGDPGLDCGTGCQTVNAQTLPDDRPDRHARVERTVRVLEDDLHAPPQAAHFSTPQSAEIATAEEDIPFGRFEQAQDQPSESGLAAAALSDHPQGLPGQYRKRHTVDSADVAADASPQPFADLEVLLQALRLNQGLDRFSHRLSSSSRSDREPPRLVAAPGPGSRRRPAGSGDGRRIRRG